MARKSKSKGVWVPGKNGAHKTANAIGIASRMSNVGHKADINPYDDASLMKAAKAAQTREV